ncbi:hypothetical protein BT63DRAFT_410150 [Microthyrium microscopicum]|uniref:Uncharacterized protein n=1 Tax=Microthyrium microscopicum TaxID=703497 RepID=A0A6A6UNS2_9PEZI|nr:hypothetical protein BT63DRAFT_410150 [Microthyrium microscopicum]
MLLVINNMKYPDRTLSVIDISRERLVPGGQGDRESISQNTKKEEAHFPTTKTSAAMTRPAPFEICLNTECPTTLSNLAAGRASFNASRQMISYGVHGYSTPGSFPKSSSCRAHPTHPLRRENDAAQAAASETSSNPSAVWQSKRCGSAH